MSPEPDAALLDRLPADWRPGVASLLRAGFAPHEVVFRGTNGACVCELRGRGLRVLLELDRESHYIDVRPLDWRDAYAPETWGAAIGLEERVTLETLARHADRIAEEAATDTTLPERLAAIDRAEVVAVLGEDFVRWTEGAPWGGGEGRPA